MRHRRIRAKILYTGPQGERGREAIDLTCHIDGARMLRAVTEIEEGEVLRDVTTEYDAQYRPVDCSMRLRVMDRFAGSGWFRFSDRLASGEMFTAAEGRLSQRVDVDAHPRAFGSHAITSDGILTSMFDLKGPKRQYFDKLFISSYAFNGATGPFLMPLSIGMEYQGVEKLTVGAGTFDCHHFTYLLGGTEFDYHPPYDIWVTTDGDYVTVRAFVGTPKDYLYELVEYAVS